MKDNGKQIIHNTDQLTKNYEEFESVRGTASATLKENRQFNVRENICKYHDIVKSAAPEEVIRWQRQHVDINDQSAKEYPFDIIIDPAMREMYQQVHVQGLTNVFDRWEQQEKVRCDFCAQGLSCQLCSQGPCRISSKVPRGACGVDAHTMVARNFIYRHVTIGTATNIFHTLQAVRALKAAAQAPESGLKIRDPEKLIKYAEMSGISTKNELNKVACDFAQWILADIGRPYYEEAAMVQTFAPARRKEIWRNLGIFPGGGNSEIAFAQTKCMTNLSADPVDFLLTAVRLGVVNEYQGLFAPNILQEIIIGTQNIQSTKQNMGLLRPEKVNIIANGHMPLIASMVIELASSSEWHNKALRAGAQGIQVLSNLGEGQQLMSNAGTQSSMVYSGQGGEWLSEEYLLATGCVDVFMFDYNCTVPTLPLYAKRFGTTMISTHEVIRLPNTQVVEFIPEKMKEQAAKILEKSIEAFKRREAEERKVYIPPYRTECTVGFSTESMKKLWGGTWEPLIEAIKKGFIRGIASLVGCTTARYGQGGSSIFRIARGLIAKDVLVLAGGCTSAVMEYTGLTRLEAAEECGPGMKAICRTMGIPPVLSYGSCVDFGKITQTARELADDLGVDTDKLPLVIGVPEYLEQKAVADACTAIAAGWLVHVAPMPAVSGSEVVIKTLTEGIEILGLGRLMVELNADKTVQLYTEHIEKKRMALGI